MVEEVSTSSSSSSDDKLKEFRSIEHGVVDWQEKDESHYTSAKFRHSLIGVGDDNCTTSSGEEERNILKETECSDDEEEERKDSSSSSEPCIEFPQDKLYGREAEMAKLQSLYEQTIQKRQSQAVLLSAYSGSGKTRLVFEAVKKFRSSPRTPASLRFVHGKHELQERDAAVPYKAISEAFSKWYTKLSPIEKERLKCIKGELEDAVGDDVSVLGDIMPCLRPLIGGCCDDSSSFTSRSINGGQQGETINKRRVNFVFYCFLKCLCKEDSPLVMYIDDLQWADPYTLELLEIILSEESTIQHLFFIGAFRSNEVNSNNHALARIIAQLQQTREHCSSQEKPILNVETIELKDLSKEDVGEFIADTLQLGNDDVQPLTEAIYRKTLGNIFFVKQSLEQLVRRNALYFDMVVFTWQWRLPQDKLEGALSGDIVEMVKSKIECLPVDLQHALAVAAHTRSRLDISTLMELLNAYEKDVHGRGPNCYNEASLVELLKRAVKQGLMDIVALGTIGEEYVFSHDRIREAALSFVTGEALDKLHFATGNILAKRGADDAHGEDWMMFTAIHHLNLVPAKFHDGDEERLRLAKLNLIVAKLAMGRAAFEDAANYAEKGIDLLPKDRWERCTVLCHDLYALAAEASRFIGNIQQMERYCTACLTAERDRPLEANYQVYYTLAIGLLYGTDRYKEAKDILVNLLKHLGCRFPRSPTAMKSSTVLKVCTVVASKNNRTESEIRKMDMMTDPTKIRAMKLLDRLFDVCYVMKDEDLLALVIFRALEYTLKYGLSVYSPRLVAAICVIFFGINDLKGCGLYAKYSQQLLRRVNHKPVEAGTVSLSYIFGSHWTTPIRECIEPVRLAHKTGLNTGAVENGCWCILFVHYFSFQAGRPLPAIASELKSHVIQMEDFGQRMLSLLGKALLRVVLGLIGLPKDQFPLNLSEAEASYSMNRETFAAYIRMEQTFLGDYEFCANSAVKHGDACLKSSPGSPLPTLDMFLSAISCLEIARQSRNPDYLKEAKRIRKWINSWAKQKNPNMQHWKALLDAEFAALKKQSNTAVQKYELAVELAKKGGYIHDAALANERCGAFILDILSDENRATHRLQEAVSLYAKWGALEKIQRLKGRFPALLQHSAVSK